jgi:hypothetical protein
LDKIVFDRILLEIGLVILGYSKIKKGGIVMKRDDEQTSEGLNEVFEIINAKGDSGELKEIVDRYNQAATSDESSKS